MCQRRSSGEEAAEKRVSVWGDWVGSFGSEGEGGAKVVGSMARAKIPRTWPWSM